MTRTHQPRWHSSPLTSTTERCSGFPSVHCRCRLFTDQVLTLRCIFLLQSLIRTWWLELKDRQLSLSVQQYTSRNFAPYVISHELSTLREPAALADLQDDSLTVKILPAVNEVTASYVVDEQTMEIAVRLPSEYPLKPVEVKDIRRVGVDERKWKAWLLAVQQVVTNRVRRRATFCFLTCSQR